MGELSGTLMVLVCCYLQSISTADCCVSQARADSLLQQGIGSMNSDQANAEALLHETADAQRAAHWALEYEDVARVSFTT